MRMKNFIFKSSSTPSDFHKICMLKLEIMQKQLRELRDDNQITHKDLNTIVKGLALLVSAPETEEEPFAPEDIRDGD